MEREREKKIEEKHKTIMMLELEDLLIISRTIKCLWSKMIVFRLSILCRTMYEGIEMKKVSFFSIH